VNENATTVVPIDPMSPDEAALRFAADVIRRGGLVAFPTETVYGLGANALDASAVERIFVVKGRPSANPLIVHVSSREMAMSLTSAWLQIADRLIENFWPGPLTLVFPKSSNIPAIVTAGGSTIALRMPSHPVALALIREAGVPLAAPSANRSSQLSPTRAEHVLLGLNGRIDLILESGPTQRGIESTVVDLTTSPPTLLRPGPITVEQLKKVIGDLQVAPSTVEDGVARSPGRMARHYSPRTPVELHRTRAELLKSAARYRQSGARFGAVVIGNALDDAIVLPANASDYAARLYDTLHALDQSNLERILIELPPETPEWLAVRDRLTRSAEPEA
jgi:L-threonylcarbamoyladenylate synthase